MMRVRMSMPIAEWPDADRRMLEAMRHKGGLFDDGGELAHLRDSSLRMLTRPWGRWLEWLRLNDPAALAEAPVARATMPRLRAWLESQHHLRPTSRHMFFTGVLKLLRIAAPEADWSAHRRVESKLAKAAGRGDPSRKAGRILSSRVLLSAALRHAEPGLELEPTPLQRAKRLRDATMVALLAVMPMRHRALTGLSIGTSLLVGPQTLTVALPGELTKNGEPWEGNVDEPVAILLRRYLEEARPFLLERGGKWHDAVWACSNGNPMSYSYVGRKVSEVTFALTGKKIPPHFFRDAAATTLSRESTRAARLIVPVLAHSDIRTAEQHYNHAGMIEACDDYAALLKRLRKGK
jgi:integrase